MLIELLGSLFNKLGIIVLGAFLLSKTKFFRRYVLKDEMPMRVKIFFTIVFGLVGILGTYSGVPVNGAIANSRSIGVIVAGLFGGPFVGIGAGLIAGIHRMIIPAGRFTAIACGLSTIIGGIIAGYSKKKFDSVRNKWLFAAILAFFIETVQMGMILLIARPFPDALELVKVIFVPMTFINSLGTGAFILLIEQIYDEHEMVGAKKAQLALNIAAKTIGILRKGLYTKSASQVADLIMENTEVDAVSITDTELILTHKGVGSDHHISGRKIYTEITKKVISTGLYTVAQTKEEIECTEDKCKLGSSIVVPLKMKDTIIGTIKLYKAHENGITDYDVVLALGLAQLFSTQLELSQIEHQKNMLQKANIQALQAQIQPHFLFNALNTIISFCRTDALRARELLIKLSGFLRYSFKMNDDMICLQDELEHLRDYLSIEEARFGNRIKIEYDCENIRVPVPPLLVQPLVENVLKHALHDVTENGFIKITASETDDEVLVTIEDNGKGIEQEDIDLILAGRAPSGGIGISNVNRRLKSIYNTELKIDSELEKGTKISMRIPKGVTECFE